MGKVAGHPVVGAGRWSVGRGPLAGGLLADAFAVVVVGVGLVDQACPHVIRPGELAPLVVAVGHVLGTVGSGEEVEPGEPVRRVVGEAVPGDGWAGDPESVAVLQPLEAAGGVNRYQENCYGGLSGGRSPL